MRRIFHFFVFFSIVSSLYSQNSETERMYQRVVESQIDFERQDNNYTLMNITFIDNRYNNIKFTHKEDIILNTLTKRQVKTKAKRGIDLIKIYPLQVLEDKIIIETLSIFHKRKRIKIYGKSTYVFKYDCEKGEYELVNKIQRMI